MNRHFRSIKDYQRALKQMSGEAFPKAMAATINTTAKAAHNRSLRNVRERFTIRNRYTERSIRFSGARVKSGGRFGYAITGSISPYMPLQETGGTVRARRQAIAIPTKAARTGGVKTGVVARRYRMDRIGRIGGGGKFFFLPTRKPGLYTRKRGKLIMIRDISISKYRLKPTRWHGDAVDQFAKRSIMEAVFEREAKKQLGHIK